MSGCRLADVLRQWPGDASDFDGSVGERAGCVQTGADVQRTSAARRLYHRNFGFGVGNGSFGLLAETLIHPSIVLALFVSQISDSNLLIGLVPAMAAGLWFLPQLFGAALTQGRARQLPFAFYGTLLRTLVIGLLGVIGFLVGSDEPSTLLIWFFVLYAIYNLAGGFTNVPMLELSARVIPANRRGLFFSQRSFWGGILGFMAGFLIQGILSQTEDFPANYALLFFAAFCALGLSTYFTAMMQETYAEPSGHRQTFASHLAEAPQLFNNSAFRRFLGFRVTLSLSAIADPFYVVYVQQQLGAPAEIIGVYIIGMTVARFGSNLIWSKLVDFKGNRFVLQVAALMRLGIPMIALLLPPLYGWDTFADRVPGGDDSIFYVFGLIFVLYGAALSAQALANLTYVMDVAEPEQRPAYFGLTNTILGFVAFIPVLGGIMVDAFSFEFVFIVTFLIAFAGVVASGLLHEPQSGDTRSIRGALRTQYRTWRQ
ncbi:MAG: MFS transporter [Sphaerobacteraceae bacterium]|nr:MAG: MFS transporter [Sphaerobacteraceae bacterium]